MLRGKAPLRPEKARGRLGTGSLNGNNEPTISMKVILWFQGLRVGIGEIAFVSFTNREQAWRHIPRLHKEGEP